MKTMKSNGRTAQKRTKGTTKYNSLFVPKNLDLKELLNKAEYAKHADRIRFVVHFLTMKRLLNPSRYEKTGGWVSIHSKVWCQALGRNVYKHTIGLAETLKIIEIDHSYSATSGKYPGKTKRYRLANAYSSLPVHRERVSHKAVLKYLQRKAKAGDHQPVHDHLWNWLTKLKIMDVPNLEEGCDNWIAFDAIRKRDFRRTRCAFGRLHTNITSLKRYLRDYLRIDGKKLVELDVRNCQPLLFAYFVCLFAQEKVGKKYVKVDLNNKQLNNTIKRHKDTPYVSLSTVPALLKPLKNRQKLPADALKLLELTETASFYDFFIDKAGMDGSNTGKYKECKKKILGQLFDTWDPNRRTPKSQPVVSVLKAEFPTAYKVCQFVKKDGYANLARLMQRIESFVIIETICEELRKDHPDVPIFTIHDAIFTTSEHLQMVGDIVRKVFVDLLGIQVQIK